MLRGKLAFDVGANVGKYSKILSQHFEKVVAIEPIQSHCETIRSLASNIEVVNAIVSDSVGERDFFESDTISTVERVWVEKSRFSKNATWKEPVKIPSTTIDKIIDQYGIPEFIKIDVEGHELEVLRGMRNHFPEVIAIEWAEELLSKTLECIKILHNQGYNKFDVCHLRDDIQFSPEWGNYESCREELFSFKSESLCHHWGMIWISRDDL